MTVHDEGNSVGQRVEKIARKWWEETLLVDIAGAAALRRCRETHQAIYQPVFHKLLGATRAAEVTVNVDRLALVACLLAHIKEDVDVTPGALGRALAERFTKSKSGDLRFRRLLAVPQVHRDETARARLCADGRRLIALMGGRVPVEDFVKTFYWWNERAKKELAMAFYQHT